MNSGSSVAGAFSDLAGEIVRQSVGEDEIAVGQSLHERAGAEAIGAVIGEIRFADDVQAGNVAHQIVIHPEAAHRVMDRGINPHRRLVGIFAGDLFVHVEEVAVALADRVFAEARDRVREIEINAAPAGADAAAFVADFLGAAGGDVARGEVAVARVFALQIIIAVAFRDFARRLAAIFLPLRHPDAAVVAERLRHEGELRLVLAADRNAGRVNLRVAGIGEERALLVGAIGGGDVAAAGVGREIKNVAVAAGGEDDGIGRVPADFAGDQIADDDALGVAVDDDEIEHLGLRKHLDGAGGDLPAERLVGAEQKLLAGLAAGVKGSRNLRAAEGAIGEESAVFAREGHALRDALVDDGIDDFRETINVRFARAKIAAFDRVVEKPVNAVAVVLIIFGGIDPALGGDAVGAARAVLEAERFYVVAQLGQGGRGRPARQPGADDDDLEFAGDC